MKNWLSHFWGMPKRREYQMESGTLLYTGGEVPVHYCGRSMKDLGTRKPRGVFCGQASAKAVSYRLLLVRALNPEICHASKYNTYCGHISSYSSTTFWRMQEFHPSGRSARDGPGWNGCTTACAGGWHACFGSGSSPSGWAGNGD
jgi:hypothetical protein